MAQNDELHEAFRDAALAERDAAALKAEWEELDRQTTELYERRRHADEYAHQTHTKLRELVTAEAERLATGGDAR